MKCLFDTSVLVPAVTDQLVNHEAAFSCFRRATAEGGQAFGSCHSLAEAYATLTALPLPRRITALEADRLVRSNFAERLELVSLSANDYGQALEITAGRGLVSGQIYDALHVVAGNRSRGKLEKSAFSVIIFWFHRNGSNKLCSDEWKHGHFGSPDRVGRNRSDPQFVGRA